jgi:hypothetical protein
MGWAGRGYKRLIYDDDDDLVTVVVLRVKSSKEKDRKYICSLVKQYHDVIRNVD